MYRSLYDKMSLQSKYSDAILFNLGDPSTSTIQRSNVIGVGNTEDPCLLISGWDFKVSLPLLLKYSYVILFSLGDSNPLL